MHSTTGLCKITLMGKSYLIGRGIIMEVLGVDVIRPIIVCGITPNDLDYYKALLLSTKRRPTMDCVTTYIHPELDTVRGPWPGIRRLYKKFLKDGIKDSHRVIDEDPAFIYKHPVPVTFATKESKANWIKDEVKNATNYLID